MAMRFLFILFLIFPILSKAQTQYVVRKGDTMLKIADRVLGTQDPNDPRRYAYVKKLRALNPIIKNPNTLELGDILLIPNDTPVVAEKKTATEAPAAPVAPILIVTPAVPEASAPPTTSPAPEAAAPAHEASTPPAAPAAAPESPSAEKAKPETAAHESHEETHSNFFFIQPRFQTLSLEAKELATETKAGLTAQSSYGLDIEYGVVLSSRFHLLLQAGFTQTQFKDIELDATSLDKQSETTTSFGVGIGFEASSNLHLDLMATQADHTYLLPATLPAYELHSVSIPGAELNISWDFYTGNTNIFGISAIGEYAGALTKDGVDYNSTSEALGAIYWKSNYGHGHTNYKTTLTFKHGDQNTSVTEQKDDLAALGVGFYF